MLARQMTIGRLPLAAFVATIGISACLCFVFLVVLLKDPPTLIVQGAAGIGLVEPARYSRSYNEAIGRAFLGAYGNWSSRLLASRIDQACALAAPELAERIRAEAAQVPLFFEPTLSTALGPARLVREDPAAGVTQFAYRATQTRTQGTFAQPARACDYLLTIAWSLPTDASPACAQVIDMRAAPLDGMAPR